MAKFRVEIGGQKYEVEAPDEKALSVAISHIAGNSQAEAPAKPAGDMPWYAKAGQAADDIVRLAANGMTFGFADKIAGALGGGGTEAERARTQEARDRAGSAGTVAEIGGSLAVPVGLAPRGLTALAPAVRTMTGAGGMAARTALAGVEGAGYGTLAAAGNDEDLKKGAVVGALAGAGGNVIGEGLSAGIGKIASLFNKNPAVMDKAALAAAKDAAYQAADQAGVVYTPQAMARIKQAVQSDLAQAGYHPNLQPGIATVLSEIDRLGQGNVTLKGIDTLRRMTSGAYNPMNKQQNMFIGKIVGAIDDAVNNPQAGDVLMGDAAGGAAALSRARDLYRRVAKLDTIENATDRAAISAASTGAGGNTDNAMRREIASILKSPSKSRGFSPDELAAMRKTSAGTPIQNVARQIGKLSPQGNGLMSGLHLIGAAASGGATIPAAGIGAVAKVLADRATPANVREVERIIAAGGQRSAAFAPPNAVQRLAESKRDAIVRALMGAGINRALTQ